MCDDPGASRMNFVYTNRLNMHTWVMKMFWVNLLDIIYMQQNIIEKE